MSRATPLRTFERPWLLVLFGVIIAGLVALAYVLGSSAGSAQQRVLDQDIEEIPVTATVEQRLIGGLDIGQGLLAAGGSIKIPSPVSNEPAVVTASGTAAGTAIAGPVFVGAVNNRAVFALPLEIPLYRDLQMWDRGPDVASLRVALGLPAGGAVDWPLRDAIGRLYTERGMCTPATCGSAVVLRQELVDVPGESVIRSVAPVGSVTSIEAPLAVVQTSPDGVLVTVPPNVIDLVGVDDEVTLAFRGEDAPGIITSIGEFSAAHDGDPAGYHVRVSFADPKAPRPSEGEAVHVSSDAGRVDALVVPLLAIRSDADGDYVLIDEDDSPRKAQVEVKVIEDGFAGVASDELAVGDRVLVTNG